MILRVVFFALMALGLVGFGTVAWISTRPPPTPVAAAPIVPAKTAVLAVGRSIRAGSMLKTEDIVAVELPNADVESDMTVDSPDTRRAMTGAMVRRTMAAKEPIHAVDVMRPGDHGFLAAVLGPGMRAMTVGVDAVTGSAGLIWPGDRVDLILTQTIPEAGLPIGRRVAAETVLSDVRVIAIDQQLVQGAENNGTADNQARTVTLEVTQEQAERVSVAVRLGRLSLAVRSADASPVARVASRNTTWAVDVSPALGAEAAPRPPQNTMRIFQGGGDAKEFKF